MLDAFDLPHLCHTPATPLHLSRQVRNRMSLEEFIRNQRGTNNKKDFPREFLTDIYNTIKYECSMCSQPATAISVHTM